MLQFLQVEGQRVMEVAMGRLRLLGGAGGDGAKQADSLQGRPALVRTERVKAQHCWGSSGVALLSFLASRITALPCQDLERG